MKSESIINLRFFAFAFILAVIHVNGQQAKPINTSYLSSFSDKVTSDISEKITGSREIVLVQITTPLNSPSNVSEELLIISNALKTAIANSQHILVLGLDNKSNATQNALRLYAEVFRSNKNDILTFIYVFDEENRIIFSGVYSLKNKLEPHLIPSFRIDLNASIVPNVLYSYVQNQGQDTVSSLLNALTYGLKIQGLQRAFNRSDLKFGYVGELLVFNEINSSTQDPIFQFNLGAAGESVLAKFEMFGSTNILTSTGAITSNFSKLDHAQLSFSSELHLYISKNFGVHAGGQLGNRQLSIDQKKNLGISKFDRFYFGMSLSF